jgi:hypothetical protein
MISGPKEIPSRLDQMISRPNDLISRPFQEMARLDHESLRRARWRARRMKPPPFLREASAGPFPPVV